MTDVWTGPQHVVIETTGAIVRIFDAPNPAPGAEYQHLIVVKGDLGVAHLSSLRDEHASILLNRDLRGELIWRLQKLGFTSGFFLRMRDGKPHRFEIPLR